MRVIAYLDEAESVLFWINSDESRVRDAVNSEKHSSKGISHSDQQVGAVAKERRNNAKRMYLHYMWGEVYSGSQRSNVLLKGMPL